MEVYKILYGLFKSEKRQKDLLNLKSIESLEFVIEDQSEVAKKGQVLTALQAVATKESCLIQILPASKKFNNVLMSYLAS